MENLIVFTLMGLLIGAAARMFYPGRRPMHILGTMALGTLGALIGWMTSWIFYPVVDGQVQAGSLLIAICGGIGVIALWAGVSYGRRLSGARKTSR
jgi:uncharacterized membrane protein YeaQ/YmgE (transglycosylase-associated protein family)